MLQTYRPILPGTLIFLFDCLRPWSLSRHLLAMFLHVVYDIALKRHVISAACGWLFWLVEIQVNPGTSIVAQPGDVMMYDPLSWSKFVVILGQHSLLHGVLYITCIPHKLLAAYAWILLPQLVVWLLVVWYLQLVQLALWLHVTLAGQIWLDWHTGNPLGIASHWKVGCSWITSGKNGDFQLSPCLWTVNIFCQSTRLMAIWWACYVVHVHVFHCLVELCGIAHGLLSDTRMSGHPYS